MTEKKATNEAKTALERKTENEAISGEDIPKGEKLRNGITELVFILDKSGSMAGMESDTVGGFNSMIAKQKELTATECYVTTVLFSTDIRKLHDRVDIREVDNMTESDYLVGGGTALLDAIGETVEHISFIHKYARPEDLPEHTIFVITTDGMENASVKYTDHKIKRMISKKEEEGWEFLFVAANIDAVSTARSIGIRSDRAANYNQTGRGTRAAFRAMECAMTSMRCEGSVGDGWKNILAESEDEEE